MPRLHEHPDHAALSAKKKPVRGHACPDCRRTDDIVRTRRVYDRRDLANTWLPDGLGVLTALSSARVLKCRRCGLIFAYPLSALHRVFYTAAVAAVSVVVATMLAVLLADGVVPAWLDRVANHAVFLLEHHPVASMAACGFTLAAATLTIAGQWFSHQRRRRANWRRLQERDVAQARSTPHLP